MATILITDDDPTLRAIATELLAPDGHRVLEAVDGNQALEIVRREPIDLLVLDMLMPEKDGLETIIAIRREKRPIRILAISSGGSMGADSVLNPALAFGADQIMVKPLRISVFARTVTEMLTRPAPVTGPFAR